MERLKLLLPIITITSLLSFCLLGLSSHSKAIAVEKPKVQLFIDDHGQITEQPPEDIDTQIQPDVTEVTINVTGDSEQEIISTGVSTVHQYNSKPNDRFRSLVYLNEEEAWSLLTDGVFTSYPKQPFGQIRNTVEAIHQKKSKYITVPIWYWANPNDDADFSKITEYKTWEVNEEIADMCVALFEDIYKNPAQPIINIADSGMGTWSVRGKMHSDAKTLSAHSIGASFDINPSTGTFRVNGTTYGNGYGNQPMPTEVWEQLPECHKKYHVLYVDSPIVQTFKAYGFYWGGDWKSSKDCMHLAFLGDGINAREIGQANYEERR